MGISLHVQCISGNFILRTIEATTTNFRIYEGRGIEFHMPTIKALYYIRKMLKLFERFQNFTFILWPRILGRLKFC